MNKEPDNKNVKPISEAKSAKKKITLDNVSPQKIDAMIDNVETFKGTKLNNKNCEKFGRAKEIAKWLAENQSGIDSYGVFEPTMEARHAQVWIQVDTCAFLFNDSAAAFRQLTDISDGVLITMKPGTNFSGRITFVINDCVIS